MKWLAFRESGGRNWRALYVARVLNTPEARERGLLGESKPFNGAAVFVFDRPGRPVMHMDGMRFALDFVFLDDLGYVLATHTAIPDDPRRIHATPGTHLVVELPAGDVARNRIGPGLRAELYDV